MFELGDDGRFGYAGRFDEDDFDGAYGELEHRYYAGEGAAFAESGAVVTNIAIAMNRNDFERMFAELISPDLRVENRSRTASRIGRSQSCAPASTISATWFVSADLVFGLLLAIAKAVCLPLGARGRRARR